MLDESKDKFDVVHMEQLKDAQIPAGSKPATEIKHYADDVCPEGEVIMDKDEGDSWEELGSEEGDQISELIGPKVRRKERRKGNLVKIPGLRRSTRIRTVHQPYQHRPQFDAA